MKNILITGGAGYIGSHVVYAALDAGYRVAVVDNLSTGIQANLPEKLPLYIGDVGNPLFVDSVLEEQKPDAILHFAGSVVVPESVSDPVKYYRNNTAASLTLINACLRHGVERFVFSSTAAVYGVLEGGLASEESPTRPINPYGWSKLMTEQMLADVAKATKLKYAVLRYFNVAGADPLGRTGQSTPRATHLIKTACEVATGKRPKLAVFGTNYDTPDGTCVRDFIHVSDLADAHLRVLEYIDRTGASVCLNCGNGRGYSVREVIASVERVTERPLPVEMAPRRAGDTPLLIAQPDRLCALLDWQPRYTDLNIIVRTALDWEAGAEDRAVRLSIADQYRDSL